MTVLTLNQLCDEIEVTKSVRRLSGIRAMLQGLLKSNHITTTMYHGLNKDIRDRSDWLKMRGNK